MHFYGPAFSIKNCNECHREAFNRAINVLPFKLHIPGYQFCGPGTRLEKRLTRSDQGIIIGCCNCREHDIAYSHSNDLVEQHMTIYSPRKRGNITAKASTSL